MRKCAVIAALVLATLAGSAPTVRADIPLIENVPAATLLLPYFEVDLGRKKAQPLDDTIFSINNASATAILTHVVFWSDAGVPILNFDVYLTGYDVQVISIRDVINGKLPQTASVGQDSFDTISPRGPTSQDINFASCSGILPPPLQLPASHTLHMSKALTGRKSPLYGKCASIAVEKGAQRKIVRGYVTIDTTNRCTVLVPGDNNYFGVNGVATSQNVIWGDYIYVDRRAGTSVGDSLVHIEAYLPQIVFPPKAFDFGEYTFYGRFVGWDGSDQREPLATNFIGRFSTQVNAEQDPIAWTSVTAWRDIKVGNSAPFKCKKPPTWYPLDQELLMLFDEQETVEFPLIGEECPVVNGLCNETLAIEALPPVFPRATQRVIVGGPVLPTSFLSGLIYSNFNTYVSPAGDVPPEDPGAAQAWMSVFVSNAGGYASGARAMHLDSATNALHAEPF